ncbi:unnamed protein product [Chrysoparadoxa australica]
MPWKPWPMHNVAPLRTMLINDGGALLLPGTEEYESERHKVWNKDSIGRPRAIAQPATVDGVVACILYAKEHEGVALVIAGGRHGCFTMMDNAFVLCMSRMRGVTVDPDAREVTVEGGCKIGDMDEACAPYGLACVTGTNPDTGVVGLSVAGGVGYLSKLHGLAIDNFVSAEMVLPDGRVISVTDETEPELFWAIRGAGTNFGVITKLTMKAHEVSTAYGVGMMINVVPFQSTARKVLTAWRDWISTQPNHIVSYAALPCGAPVLPLVCHRHQQQHQQQRPNLANAASGRFFAFTNLVFPFLCGFGALFALKMFKKMEYQDLQKQLEKHQASGHYFMGSAMLKELPDEAIDTFIKFQREKNVNSCAAVLIFPMGGKIGAPPLLSTAYRPRNAKYFVVIEGQFKPGSDKRRREVMQWAHALKAALNPFTDGDACHDLQVNIGEVDDATERNGMLAHVERFISDVPRAVAVKKHYDSKNMFSMNRNILPEDREDATATQGSLTANISEEQRVLKGTSTVTGHITCDSFTIDPTIR